MTTIKQSIYALDLAEARRRLEAGVRAAPSDPGVRLEYADCLVLLQDWDKADRQYDMASTLDPSFAAPTALARQLIRAEVRRLQVFEEGRAPEVVGEADPVVAEGLRRLIDLRDPATTTATAPLQGAEDDAAGDDLWSLSGRPFEGLRDLDDRTAEVLEVLTSTGAYYWIPWRAVVRVELQAPERLRDLVWRPADLQVNDGPEGRVYLPTIYQGSAAGAEPRHLLGRQSDWIERKGLICGVGLRMLLCGDEAVALGDGGAQTLERRPQ